MDEAQRASPEQAQIPLATYRLQLNKDFTFNDVTALVPYLHDLGISHCYLSPYLKARPGSAHGYDIVDHGQLNPDIGTHADFARLSEELRRYGMGIVADVVPNHMAVMGRDNAWWLDVLEHGRGSAFARFFDIDWNPINRHLINKVLVPVLGDHYGKVLEAQQIQLRFNPSSGAFSAHYFEHEFPIDPQSYPEILGPQHELLYQELQTDHLLQLEYHSVVMNFAKLPPHTAADHHHVDERHRDTPLFKQHLATICAENPSIREFIEKRVEKINRSSGRGWDQDLLHNLLEQQPYRLAYWRVAGDEINYRRFFDINELAGLRTEYDAVFEATHRLVLAQIGQQQVQGLRLDHADGLYDPVAYYERLKHWIRYELNRPQQENGFPLYIVAEKIVANYEYLASDWPIDGTTGYEFADVVTGLFVDSDAEKALSALYHRFIAERADFDEILYQAKIEVTHTLLSSELNVLANELNQIAELNPATRDYTLNALHGALREIVACFPVYRTYINSAAVSKADRQYIDWAVAQAKHRSYLADKSVFEFIARVLLVEAQEVVAQRRLIRFVMKFQQYTAPVMAKGLEDTALYRYHRLISLNDVGSDPRRFGYSVSAFHQFNQARLAKWPHTMLCTSTHDSKRSGDTRSRINVLSECAERWQTEVQHWSRVNRRYKRKLGKRFCPTRHDEYLFYQTLIGIWPTGDQEEEKRAQVRERLRDYMVKAVREAKRYSSWRNPDEDYEQAVTDFIEQSLDPVRNRRFVEDVDQFLSEIAGAGFYNALAQTVLKLTSPGVPDIYQGDELWRFQLVDPDNRGRVDFETRRRQLQELKAELRRAEVYPGALASALLDTLGDGRLKMYVTMRVLGFRRQKAGLFQNGDYLKLATHGARSEQLVAFSRRYGDDAMACVVPRLLMQPLAQAGGQPVGRFWADTWLALPDNAPARYRDIFTDRLVEVEVDNGQRGLPVSAALAQLPVCVLSAE